MPAVLIGEVVALVARMDVTIDVTSSKHALQQTLKEAGRLLRDALDTMKDSNMRPQEKESSKTHVLTLFTFPTTPPAGHRRHWLSLRE